ncbi:MAG: hypothetical protein JO257_37700 [Deltaproteobacteria bacterium]|nr:hypothetical protein [Deltaproteobacteria bacterium]
MHRALLTLTLTFVLACRAGARDGAPCSAVATRQRALAAAALGSATVAPETRALVERSLPALQSMLTRACTEGAWSPAIRDCMVQAPDHAAFQACEQQLTDDQRRALDLAARGETGPP